jgi:signal transduction histidine kinase
MAHTSSANSVGEAAFALIREDDAIVRLRALIAALAKSGSGLPPTEVDALAREADDELRLLESTRHQLRAAEEAARRAEEASRLKDDFLATVSHELRTPLSSILGWTKLLRDGRCDPGFATKGLDVIERNARSQQRIIEDMLDVSRIIAGKLRIDTEPVDLAALAGDVVESLRPTASSKKIELTIDARFGPCRLAGDSVRLRQIFWNLLSNAVKFTPDGGHVAVALEQHGDRIVVRVTDSGKGIDPTFLPHVFERFRQADSSTTREHAGLGLTISRNLAQLMGGDIHVQSQLGRGSSFSLWLPCPIRALPNN